MSSETKKISTVGFRLSTEELLYVLTALELKTLPSLGPSPLDSISAEQKQQILTAGFNSLRARDWVKLTTDPQHPIIMDNLFVSSLLICASANKIMSLTKQAPDLPSEQIFLFQTPDVIVSHHLVEPGVHEFIMTGDRHQLVKGLMEFLDLERIPFVKDQVRFSLPADSINNIMEAVSKRNLPLLGEMLNRIGINKDYSLSFLDCLKNLQKTTVIMLADFPQKMTSADQVTGNTISIISSDVIAWQIENNIKKELLFSLIGPRDVEHLLIAWAGSSSNTAA